MIWSLICQPSFNANSHSYTKLISYKIGNQKYFILALSYSKNYDLKFFFLQI